MRKVIRSFGLALILWGLVLIFIGQVSITGFVIVGELNFEWRFVLGLVLVVGGVLILTAIPQRTRQQVGKTLADIVTGVSPAGSSTVVLLDASFVKELRDNGYELPRNFFGNVPHAFLDKVLEEMRHRKGDHPLVDGSTIRYYTSHLGTTEMNYTPREETLGYVNGLYIKSRPKSGSFSDRSKFENGADIKLLGYAVEHPNQRVIILSNDEDIKTVARRINSEKRASIEVIDSRQVRRQAA